MLTEEGY